jgi:hypothetical protein
MTARSGVCLMLSLSGMALAGCGSKESVMLSARLESPELTVTGNALVTDVTGSFDLELALGNRASDPTSVDLGTFSLQRDGDVLLNPLELDTDPSFPVDVGVGGSKHVEVTITHPDGDPELANDLCSSELQIVGTLTDSLGDDRPITVTSGRFLPDCSGI